MKNYQVTTLFLLITFSGLVKAREKNNCNEPKMTSEDLNKIAKKSKNQIEFLKSIPKNSMSTFSFVHKSDSAQGPGVSEEFPGVIRMTQDGKLVIRYTCDPSKPTYNRIEVLRFDDKAMKYIMESIDFHEAPKSRIHENPKSCMKCHSPDGENPPYDPRPNFQPYNKWAGFYGGEDDTFNKVNGKHGIPVTQEELDRQRKSFLKFKKDQADNPCYSTLPWEKKDKTKALLYPYSELGKESKDYSVRPNLKLTEVQCRLVGKRLARRFMDRPEYPYIKYAIGMKAMECPQYKEDFFSQIIPEMGKPSVKLVHSPDPDSKFSTYSASYRAGKAMGIKNMEWTLHFNKPDETNFACGISPNNRVFDMGIGDVFEGDIMQNLAKEIPGLDKTFSIDRGESPLFGAGFSCIDDLGAGIYSKDDNKKLGCEKIFAAQMKLQEDITGSLQARSVLTEMQQAREKDCFAGEILHPELKNNISDIQKINLEILTDGQEPDAQRGKVLAQTICMQCHNPKMEKLNFFTSEDITKEHVARDPRLIERISSRINDTEDPMPPEGEPLKAQEKRDLIEYLKSFKPKD